MGLSSWNKEISRLYNWWEIVRQGSCLNLDWTTDVWWYYLPLGSNVCCLASPSTPSETLKKGNASFILKMFGWSNDCIQGLINIPVLTVSPNNWNLDFSPLKTPAVTGPLCRPNRIFKSPKLVDVMVNVVSHRKCPDKVSNIFFCRQKRTCIRSQFTFQNLRQIVHLVFALISKFCHNYCMVFLWIW